MEELSEELKLSREDRQKDEGAQKKWKMAGEAWQEIRDDRTKA